MRYTPLQPVPTPLISHPSLGQLFGSLGDTGSPACAHETQRLSPIPRVVFVRPIVGRLEDLTTARLTTFHHSAADILALNNEDGFLLAAPQVDPPALLAIEYRPGGQEGIPPLWGWFRKSQAYPLEMNQDPPYSYNGRKGSKRSPLEPKTLLKTQTRLDGKDPTPRSYQRTGL